MKDKIAEIRKALENGVYQAALSLTLTLPDICGQVENGVPKGTRTTYIDWFDKHIDAASFSLGPASFIITMQGQKYAEFDGAACYALRCRFLHNGSDDVENNTYKPSIDKFELLTPDSLPRKGDGHSYRFSATDVIARLDIKYLCEQICNAAEKFYDEWPDKADFNDHAIILH